MWVSSKVRVVRKPRKTADVSSSRSRASSARSSYTRLDICWTLASRKKPARPRGRPRRAGARERRARARGAAPPNRARPQARWVSSGRCRVSPRALAWWRRQRAARPRTRRSEAATRRADPRVPRACSSNPQYIDVPFRSLYIYGIYVSASDLDFVDTSNDLHGPWLSRTRSISSKARDSSHPLSKHQRDFSIDPRIVGRCL